MVAKVASGSGVQSKQGDSLYLLKDKMRRFAIYATFMTIFLVGQLVAVYQTPDRRPSGDFFMAWMILISGALGIYLAYLTYVHQGSNDKPSPGSGDSR